MGYEARLNPRSLDGRKSTEYVGLARLMHEPIHRVVIEMLKAWWEKRRG